MKTFNKSTLSKLIEHPQKPQKLVSFLSIPRIQTRWTVARQSTLPLPQRASSRILATRNYSTTNTIEQLTNNQKTKPHAPTTQKACPFCNTPNALPQVLCTNPTCLSPQPIPSTVSYYTLLKHLPPPYAQFKLDTRALRREFLRLQQSVHPDNHATDPKKRGIAEATSSVLNRAYSTLLQPLGRAEYLLGLHGVVMEDGEKLTDGALLMTVMDAREQIEDARSTDDLVDIKAETGLKIGKEEDVLETCFKKGDFGEAKKAAIRLRYWLNIKKAADDWEPGKEIRLEH